MASIFIPEAKYVLNMWGKNKKAISNFKDELEIDYIGLSQTVIDMTESLIRMKIVPISI